MIYRGDSHGMFFRRASSSKGGPRRGPIHDFEMGDRQIQEFPRLDCRGCHLQAQLSACSTVTWINLAQSREMFRTNGVVNGFFVVFLLHPLVETVVRPCFVSSAEGSLPMLSPVDPNPAISADILHRYGFHHQHCWVESSVQRLK